MNSHLNIFKTYTKDNNRTHQLENDLTRAFAISLQEDPLFFHEVLKEILKESDEYYNHFFGSLERDTYININIQKKTSQITNFEHIFAITLSEAEISNFWEQKNTKKYDPICDLVIEINNIVFVFEVKRNNIDCTSQLYNQIFNIFSKEEDTDFSEEDHKEQVTPFDLNWKKLMAIAIRVSSFEKTMNCQNRFLSDFISLVREHNFQWLPEASISSLNPRNKEAILRRLESTIEEVIKKEENKEKIDCNGRLGLKFNEDWAKEILFKINEEGSLKAVIYPGNTKSQGRNLFKKDKNIRFRDKLNILGDEYDVKWNYHIKFTSWQKYFEGLWFTEKELIEELYTEENFKRYTGRKKREEWGKIEGLFDKTLKFDWKEKCNWHKSMEDSKKTQFDISFGYEVHIEIPFEKLKKLDQKQDDLNGLIELIEEIDEKFNKDLLLLE